MLVLIVQHEQQSVSLRQPKRASNLRGARIQLLHTAVINGDSVQHIVDGHKTRKRKCNGPAVRGPGRANLIADKRTLEADEQVIAASISVCDADLGLVPGCKTACEDKLITIGRKADW